MEKTPDAVASLDNLSRHGFLGEAVGLFVDDSDEAELYFSSCFEQQIAIFRVEVLCGTLTLYSMGGGIMPPIGFSYAASKRFALGR